jgi:hypothetical protein
MTLAINETDRIVALRLDGRTLRDVAAETGHALGTVHKVWQAYLAETAQARRPELGLLREEMAQRLERNAADAREGAMAALDRDDHREHRAYLREERGALADLAKLYGGDKFGQLAGRPTTADPLPWREGIDALAYRVAEVVRGDLRAAAFDRLLDPMEGLAAAPPPVAELAAVVADALADPV